MYKPQQQLILKEGQTRREAAAYYVGVINWRVARRLPRIAKLAASLGYESKEEA